MQHWKASFHLHHDEAMNANKTKPEDDPLATDEDNNADVKKCEFLSEPCLEMYVKKETEDDLLAVDRIAETYMQESSSEIKLKSADSSSPNITPEVKDEINLVTDKVCHTKCESEIKMEFEDSHYNLTSNVKHEENSVLIKCVLEGESEDSVMKIQ
ncbi:uncharacterized protein [Periplaneta americana]|uniref:uncharacterized protein isoform X4 n=1 Tax=Periplaneta americana TaxID=6978 RepID=UPI0037E9202C